MNQNSKVIRSAFKKWEKDIEAAVLKEIENLAQNLIYEAIKARMAEPEAHNFTGNLLNSIVAAVYKDKELDKAFFASDTGIRQPRYYEMTASHGRYHFKIDYSGQESNYEPEIETLHRKGKDDAYEFISTYRPTVNGFVVVVAYTAEYATWVEIERSTTGYIRTLNKAKTLALKMFELKSSAK